MNKTPIYRDPPTFRDYEDFKIGIAYTSGWNDAMNYIFRGGKGYMPYRRDKQYGE